MVEDQLQPILQWAPRNLHTSDLLLFLNQSDVVHNMFSDQPRKSYAVVVGQHVGIHRTKDSTLSSLGGFAFPCWKELPTF